MLRSTLAFGLILTIGNTLTLVAGTTQPVKSDGASSRPVRETPDITVSCQHLVINGTTTTYIDNVNIKAGDFEVKDASRALYDQEKKKITVLGAKEFSGKGEVILHNPDQSETRIEYVLGTQTINIFQK